MDTVVSQVSDTVFNGAITYFSPVWIPPTESEAHPLLVVFFSADRREKSNSSTLVEEPGLLPALIEKADIDYGVHATACSVSAYWNTGEIQISDSGLNVLIDPGRLSTNQRSENRKIDLDFTNANTLQSAKFPWDLRYYRFSKHDPTLYGIQIGLAAFLATGLSNIPLSERIKEISDSKGFEEVWKKEIPTTNYTAFRIISKEFGFGYGTRSTSVYLSMTVLLMYCIIVVGYVVYTVTTGLASTAWSSGVELMTLALQSKRPDHLRHTGVGIDSLKTLRESVGIRVNTDNEVELVFAHDRDFETRGLRKLERNAAY
jgi:hypothetical protein